MGPAADSAAGHGETDAKRRRGSRTVARMDEFFGKVIPCMKQ
jgi:hypothetical protein